MAGSRQEIVTWKEVEKLITTLIPQFDTAFDCIMMVAPGGVIPAGILAAALRIDTVLLAQVKFPPDPDEDKSKLFSWPDFIQFPEDEHLDDREILIVNNAWGAGRSSRAVQKKIEAAGGSAHTCVLHYNPYRNLLKVKPEYYGAITDAYIIYPWEIDIQGPDRVVLENGGRG